MSPAPQTNRSAAAVEVSVILPTLNEASTIRKAIRATQTALGDMEAHEIVVVDDDSADGTSAIVEGLARHDQRVRLLRRRDCRGLASAIVDGLTVAEGHRLVVMDADLQHDPATIPLLVKALDSADVVVASRYAPGGFTGSWSLVRRGVSRFATYLSRVVLGLSTTDPMSGFFAIRRGQFHRLAHTLRPRGYKALLEILARTPDARFAEVPYRFRPREAGTSKLGPGVILDLLLSLFEIRTGRSISPRFLRYCAVGCSGVAVQLGVVSILQTSLGDSWALAVAVLAAMLSNFTLNNAWTFRDSKLERGAFVTGLARFIVVCMAGAALNYAISLGLHRVSNVPLVWTSLAGIAAATIWNYQLNRRWTWRDAKKTVVGEAAPRV